MSNWSFLPFIDNIDSQFHWPFHKAVTPTSVDKRCYTCKAKKNNRCGSGNIAEKNRVGRSGFYFIFIFYFIFQIPPKFTIGG